jgi:hypothetical protein
MLLLLLKSQQSDVVATSLLMPADVVATSLLMPADVVATSLRRPAAVDPASIPYSMFTRLLR